jgi:TolA-binding protein
VAFSSGRVAVHVEKLSHEQRFVMTLPDGELEVRGTRFIVEVKDGHTQRVEVTEGSVALRLPPVREELLRAGDHWSAPETAPAGVPAPVAAPPVPPVVEPAVSLGVSSAPAHPPAARTSERSSHPTTAASQEAASAEAPTRSPAGEMFSSAMSAFSSGAYERADALLCEFTRTFPNDARAEDACFLRIAIRKRLGDATAVKARARDYLDQHPQGLRRAEVERLLQ